MFGLSPAEMSIAILVVAMVLYITEVIPLAATAVLSCILLIIFKVVPAKIVWDGLSSDVNLLIAGMIVVGSGIFESGLAMRIGKKILDVGRGNAFILSLTLFLVTMILSAFLSNSATTATMLPVALALVAASKGKLHDKTLLMPMAGAAVTGGVLTLAGSTPQVIVAGVLEKGGYPALSFFEIGKAGAILCAALLLYNFTIGKFLARKIWGVTPEHGPLMKELLAKGNNGAQEGNNGGDTSKQIRVSLVLALCVGLFIWGKWPLGTVAMIGALLTVITGCITEKRTYELMDWRTVMLLGASIGFAAGFDKSGGGQLLANMVLGYLGDAATPFTIFAAITFVAVILTQFMSNTSCTAMFAPIMLALAKGVGANPHAMLVGLALCTNASLATPVATPPMTIVLGGGYTFFDYIKWCGPINLIMWVLVLIFVPLLYGGLAM